MNQTPEQLARDQIDKQLKACGWQVQNKQQINLFAAAGVAVREYRTDIGSADYILFVDQQPVGVIEAKKAEEGQNLTAVEEETWGQGRRFSELVQQAEHRKKHGDRDGVLMNFVDESGLLTITLVLAHGIKTLKHDSCPRIYIYQANVVNNPSP